MNSQQLTFAFGVVLLLMNITIAVVVGMDLGAAQATDRCQHVVEMFLRASPAQQRLLCEVR
jgi:hypothetical protein